MMKLSTLEKFQDFFYLSWISIRNLTDTKNPTNSQKVVNRWNVIITAIPQKMPHKLWMPSSDA
jgi:hypothetical protein